MIELYLSSDGKHTVHAAAETPEKLEALELSARLLYERVLGTYGTKAEMWREATNAKGNGGAKAATPNTESKRDAHRRAPRCPVHSREMVLRKGRFGAFWSCPTRQLNGSWCQVTQEVTDSEQAPEPSK